MIVELRKVADDNNDHDQHMIEIFLFVFAYVKRAVLSKIYTVIFKLLTSLWILYGSEVLTRLIVNIHHRHNQSGNYWR